MKKTALLLILLLSVSVTAKSQLVIALLFGDKLYTPKTELGLNVGANISNVSNVDNTKYVNQLGLGLYFKWKFQERWQFQPEFYFRYPQGGKKLPPYSLADPDLNPVTENSTIIRKSQYFSLPLLINYRIWDELRFSIGPQFSFMTSNEDIFFLTLETGEEVYIRRKGHENLNRFDVGGTTGLSYTLRQGKGVTLAARYHHGFIEPDPDISGGSNLNFNFNFYVGIPIGVGKEKVGELSSD